MSVKERIQDAAENDELIIGANETVDQIDTVETVVLAMNTPVALQEKIADAAEDSDATIQTVDVDNRELGSLCMKPFTASVVGITQ